VYRLCIASFEAKLWEKGVWGSWERSTKTISSRTGKMRRTGLTIVQASWTLCRADLVGITKVSRCSSSSSVRLAIFPRLERSPQLKGRGKIVAPRFGTAAGRPWPVRSKRHRALSDLCCGLSKAFLKSYMVSASSPRWSPPRGTLGGNHVCLFARTTNAAGAAIF
jgi:hypothetical protein